MDTRFAPLLRLGLSMALLMFVVARPALAATIPVTSTADAGPGSLRQAIADAANGDTIGFALDACPCTITLTTGELLIDKNLTISGPGEQLLTISGNFETRVFRIAPGVVAEIGGLRVRLGIAEDFGGGIRVDQATLTLRHTVFSGNSAGAGGGIFYQGTLTAINSTFFNNHANVGAGGAILGFGTLTITDSDFMNNLAGFGGAISANALFLNRAARITGGAFSGNSAGTGGAVVIGPAVRATNRRQHDCRQSRGRFRWRRHIQ